MIVIYKITSPSGRIYIGQTWNLRDRFRRYLSKNCKNQPFLFNSFKKYGVENHKFEVIVELPEEISQDALNKHEVFQIELYKKLGFKLLNMTDGGSGGKGYKHTEESLVKMRKPKSEDFKVKMRNRIITEETKNKMSESAFGRKASEETKQKMSAMKKGENHPNWGKKLPKEQYNKMVKTKTNNRTTGKGLKRSEETKQKMRKPKTKEHLKNRLDSYIKTIEKRGVFKQSPESIIKSAESRKIPILQFDINNILIKEWKSSKDAGDALHICNSTITKCCKNKKKTCGGFIWKYNQ